MLQMLSGGIDDAGRGCFVGPLVVGGVSADEGGVKELMELGVRDSKTLSPSRRASLYPEILKICARAYWAASRGRAPGVSASPTCGA